MKEYDLADAEFRKTANDLDFICSVGGKRYKICKDQPGLCRITYDQKCFLFICKKAEQVVDYIAGDRLEFLMQADTRCFSKKVYAQP